MISGKKVQLRGITHEDTSLIYQWVNREDLRDLTGTLYPVSEYEHIYVDNSCIGTIGIKNIDYFNSNAELFISIGEEAPDYAGGGQMQLIH